MCIADVAVDRAGQTQYSYLVPDDLQQTLQAGDFVQVPLRRRQVNGFVTCIERRTPPSYKLRQLRLSQPRVTLPPDLFRLAQWGSRYYQSTLPAFLNAVVPAAVRKGVEQQRIKLVQRCPDHDPASLTPRQCEVYELLPDGWHTLAEAVRLCGCSSGTLERLINSGALEQRLNTQQREQRLSAPQEAHSLNSEQRTAVHAVQDALQEPRFETFLLHGVTGSGKTLVYMEAAETVIARGQQVLILLPEIALTPQLAARFRNRFERVSIWHSAVSDGERAAAWHAAARGEIDLVIGTRSALFAPLPDPGLIVVDEEHDQSYKQDSMPRYQGRDLAVVYASQRGIPVVLGSATPSCESIYNVRQGRYTVLQLKERPGGAVLPAARVVDMRVECRRQQQRAVLSQDLIDALERCHQAQQQSIVLLNRRGWSPIVSCPRCGYVCECTHCDISMTWHRGADQMRCHLCGDQRKLPAQCPVCAYPELAHRGMGTERLAAFISEQLPSLRILRMDADTVSRRQGHADLIQSFARGEADCLLGTQMVAKGLNFPRVTLVGVVDADHGLAAPDFRAAERTYQLIAQVSGRAGRAEAPGEVVVQAYDPQALAIECALHNRPRSFYDAELELRQQYAYPPFAALMRIIWRGEDAAGVQQCAERHCAAIRECCNGEVVLGPNPTLVSFIKGNYRWHALIKGSSRGAIQQLLKRLRKSDILDKPGSVQLVLDIDPYDCA